MGVYIPGMEMPQEGFIEVLIWEDGRVQQTGQSFRVEGHDYYAPYTGETPNEYTAIPTPPHGRLIDADALKAAATKRLYASNHGSMAEAYYAALIDLIDNAPTIIPADETNT